MDAVSYPFAGREKRLRLQLLDRGLRLDCGQSNRSDIGRVKMRHDIILVVIGQSAGTVVTQADDRRNKRRCLRDFDLMMRALARGYGRARAKRQRQRDTEESQPARPKPGQPRLPAKGVHASMYR